MQNYKLGWLPNRPNFRDFSIETAVENLRQQTTSPVKEVIKLKKATFVEDDNSPILDRAIQLLQTPEQDGKSRKRRQQQYLILPLRSSISQNQYDEAQANNQYSEDLYLPKSVDLRPLFPPITNQRELSSCTAHAGVALVQYFQQRAFGEYIEASPLFLYKVTRKFMQLSGDSGIAIGPMMRAMMLFGIPPEDVYPYSIQAFDDEPPAFSYAYAQNYQTLSYFNIDRHKLPPEEILVRIRIAIAAGFPPIFGFTSYSSLFSDKTKKSGKIPYPDENEKIVGGHCLVAVGYDDKKIIRNSKNPGAFRIRNCWGTDWGKNGYGWLPYDYVLDGLAVDWWSLVKAEWVASENFGLEIGSNGLLKEDYCIPPCVK